MISSPFTTGTDDPPGITAFSFLLSSTPSHSFNNLENGTPSGASITEGLFRCPLMQNIFTPSESFTPRFLYHSEPFFIIYGTVASVSVLLMIVGLPYSPCTAGKGGFILGIPLLPSIDSNIAVSSPTI